MTPEQIAELERLLAAATPGPWQARFLHRVFRSARMHADEDHLYFHEPESQDWADCEAIAALRNAAPALIAAWKELRERKISHPLTAIAAAEIVDQAAAMQRRAESAERERDALESCGWVYKILVNKHATGEPLAGQIEISGTWGDPSEWLHFSATEPDDPWIWWKTQTYVRKEQP